MDFSNEIKSRGMLARLNIHQWHARRLDKAAGRAAAEAMSADAKQCNLHKALINKEHLKPIQDIVTQARKAHNETTVPWTYQGVGMLPGARVAEYHQTMQDYEDQFYAAVEKLISNYGLYVAEAARGLGQMFDATEYPTAAEVRSKFSFAFALHVLPDVSLQDFRIDVPDSVREKVEANMREQYLEMTDHVKTAVFDACAHLIERVEARITSEEDESIERIAPIHATVASHLAMALDTAKVANIVDDTVLHNVLSAAGDFVWHADGLASDVEYRARALSVAREIIALKED